MTGNKSPVHGRKLCSPCTANFQYKKMEKPALKTVYITGCTVLPLSVYLNYFTSRRNPTRMQIYREAYTTVCEPSNCSIFVEEN